MIPGEFCKKSKYPEIFFIEDDEDYSDDDSYIFESENWSDSSEYWSDSEDEIDSSSHVTLLKSQVKVLINKSSIANKTKKEFPPKHLPSYKVQLF